MTEENNANPANPTPNNPPVSPVPVTPATPTPIVPSNPIVNATPSPGTNQVGVFTTAQSLATFSGSTAAVTTIWLVVGKLLPGWGAESIIVPLIISFIIGIIIYIGTVSRGMGIKQKIIEFAVAIINSFIIAAAATGLTNFNPTPSTTENKPNTTVGSTVNSNSNANQK